MVQAYNFLASWQLFPEKGTYEFGDRPRSGIYKMESVENERLLAVSMNWVTLENQAFASRYIIMPDGQEHGFENPEIADSIKASFTDGLTFETQFCKDHHPVLQVVNEIMPNGFLKITQKGLTPEQKTYTNVEIYHKQMSVLPYSASVAGALIKPTEEGVIRHKALTAMEEQTNMQLGQIRKQIELLALQAQEIQKRKELSLLIYSAKLNFSPVIGQTYFMYEKADDSHLLSLVSPHEWGGGAGPYKRFVAAVKLLADHTWMEVV
jgi:predicted transcriptional regulator